MNTKSLLWISVLGLVLVAFWQLASAQAVRENAGQKWEYKVIEGGQDPLPHKKYFDQLSKLGEEGWELVAVEPATTYSTGRGFPEIQERVIYLKRPKD